jgi:hypothetical protein
MTHYVEAKGKKHKPKRELHHLKVLAHPDGTPESPRWVIEHHAEETDSPDPEKHEFTDGHEMLAHVANCANVPEMEG